MNLDKSVTARLDSVLLDKLEEFARKERRKKTDAIRLLLEEALNARERKPHERPDAPVFQDPRIG